jgi:hypothetical protein
MVSITGDKVRHSNSPWLLRFTLATIPIPSHAAVHGSAFAHNLVTVKAYGRRFIGPYSTCPQCIRPHGAQGWITRRLNM